MDHREDSSTAGVSRTAVGRPARGRPLLAALLALTLSLPAVLSAAVPGKQDGAWTATWGTAPAAVAPDQVETLDGQTLRLIVRVSSGGAQLRVRLSNEFGTEALRIGAAQVALRASGAALQPGSERVLAFGGQPAVTIAAGEAVFSDPVALDVRALAELAVSLYFPESVKARTVHRSAFQTNYLSFPGNFVGMSNFQTARSLTSWPVLTEVDVLRDVLSTGAQGALVAFGDSITDGSSSTLDANRRWPDLLAQRMQAARRGDAGSATTAAPAGTDADIKADIKAETKADINADINAGTKAARASAAVKDGVPELGIVNRGIGGNRLLRDPAYAPFGQAGLKRFGRDVLGTAGVRHVIVLLGINDIGHPGSDSAPASEAVSASELIDGYRQLATLARARGVKIYGVTLTPFEGTVFPGYYSAEKEAVRQEVNRWIRSGNGFDGVIDADQTLRDPANPARLLPAFDSGDHLHPNDAGMQALADAVPLGLFAPRSVAKPKPKPAPKPKRARAHSGMY